MSNADGYACPVCKHTKGLVCQDLIALGSHDGRHMFQCRTCTLEFGFVDPGSEEFWAKVIEHKGQDPLLDALMEAKTVLGARADESECPDCWEEYQDVADGMLARAELCIFGTLGGLPIAEWNRLNGPFLWVYPDAL